MLEPQHHGEKEPGIRLMPMHEWICGTSANPSIVAVVAALKST